MSRDRRGPTSRSSNSPKSDARRCIAPDNGALKRDWKVRSGVSLRRSDNTASWTGYRKPNWSPWPVRIPRGSRLLDDAIARRQTGGIGDCGLDRARGGPGHSEKNALHPWRKEHWVLPPEQNADFVCAMEDVLEVYQRPYDPRRPVVCFDEQSKQLTKETRQPVQAAPGQPKRVDYEYERNGTANLFLWFEPLAGQRYVKVTDRRTTRDFAEALRDLIAGYPMAENIVLVLDNLNTHKPASFYDAFAPDEARRLIDRLEI